MATARGIVNAATTAATRNLNDLLLLMAAFLVSVSGPLGIHNYPYTKFSTKLGRDSPRVALSYGAAAKSDAIRGELPNASGNRSGFEGGRPSSFLSEGPWAATRTTAKSVQTAREGPSIVLPPGKRALCNHPASLTDAPCQPRWLLATIQKRA